jgi:hypothetical protein
VIHEVAAVIRIGSGDDTENIDVVRGRTIAPRTPCPAIRP